jgi:HD-GYP domain-containing protein (c-di-GMP phosphodiesterase class II)/predicted ATPase/tRNA A-37 threonylcarbamoyl transferase component Bud32
LNKLDFNLYQTEFSNQIELDGYTILHILNANANSVIYKAVRKKDRRTVVLKTQETSSHNQNFSPIKNEFEILNQLHLPGVVKALDFEIIQDVQVLVLEYIDMLPLSKQLIERNFYIEEILTLFYELAKCLGEIHKQNIIHKDINPSNILWDYTTKSIKIIDFGISEITTNKTCGLLNNQRLTGTVEYISPEQTGRINQNLDYRSDYYSLGMSMYELVTNKKAFFAEDYVELIYMHVAEYPKEPNQINESCPNMLSDIIMKLIKKSSIERYQSSYGICRDVRICKDWFHYNIDSSAYTLGERDIPERFQISEKIYGRAHEISTLHHAFLKVCEGTLAKMILIKGETGMGKSFLAKEILPKVLEKRGYFIESNFSLNPMNNYETLIHVFNQLLENILLDSSERFNWWKERLTGSEFIANETVLKNLPNLKFFFETSEPFPEKTLVSSSNQEDSPLLKTFQFIIETFNDTQTPLVIFIKEIQWMTSPFLDFLSQILSNPNGKSLLIIGSYRTDADEKNPEIGTTFEDFIAQKKCFESIQLQPLTTHDLVQLLNDTFRNHHNDNHTIAHTLFMKTRGYPYYVHTFLNQLHESDIIRINQSTNKWYCDKKLLSTSEITENVVKIYLSSIKELSYYLLTILKNASVIGSEFHLELLSKISHVSIEQLQFEMEEVIQKGYIDSLENIESKSPLTYRFSHRHIAEFLYEELEPELQNELNYKIANLLLEKLQKEKLRDLMTVTDYYNKTNKISEKETIKIAKFNLSSGLIAEKSFLHETSYNYFVKGITLISEFGWESEYILMKRLHIEAGKSALQLRKFNEMNDHIDAVIHHARNALDAAEAYMTKIISLNALDEGEKAVDLAIQLLKKLGSKIKKNPPAFDVFKKNTLIAYRLFKIDHFEIPDLPRVRNKRLNTLARIVLEMNHASSFQDQKLRHLLTLEMMNLTLKHGLNESSHLAFLAYSIKLLHQHEFKKAFEFSKIAKYIFENPIYDSKRSYFHFLYTLTFGCFYFNFEDIDQQFDFAFELAEQESNSVALVSIHRLKHVFQFFSNQFIPDIIQRLQKTSTLCDKYHQPTHKTYTKFYLQFLTSIHDQSFLQNEKSPDHQTEVHHSQQAMIIFHSTKTMQSYLLHDFEKGLQHALSFRQSLIGKHTHPLYLHFCFYESLLHFRQVNDMNKKAILKIILQNQKTLTNHAKFSPHFYQSKVYILEAELHRVLKNYSEAEDKYFLAIESAQKFQLIIDEAICLELLGQHYHQLQRFMISFTCINRSIQLYDKVGAYEVSMNLFVQYNDLIKKYGTKNNQVLKTPQKMYEYTDTAQTNSPTFDSYSSIDFMSAIKASQAISSELVYENLIEKMKHVVVENSGADKCLLLCVKKNEIEVEANFLGPQPNEYDHLEEFFPRSIIEYVIRTKTKVLHNDPSQLDIYKKDSYFATSSPKSILCIPLIYRGKINKVLYFENSKSEGIFQKDQTEVLNMLASQAVISIENSYLNEEIESTLTEIIFVLGELAEARSKETGNHVMRVAEYSYIIAKELGLPKEDIKALKLASPMHDIGKLAIPDNVLLKPGNLNKEEFNVIKTHTTIGYDLLKNSNRKLLQVASIIAHQHHEKFNGQGYPQGLKGKEIDILARITAIADVFDALACERIYKKAWELDEIIFYFKNQSGEHFDPNLVNILFDVLDEILVIKEKLKD